MISYTIPFVFLKTSQVGMQVFSYKTPFVFSKANEHKKNDSNTNDLSKYRQKYI